MDLHDICDTCGKIFFFWIAGWGWIYSIFGYFAFKKIVEDNKRKLDEANQLLEEAIRSMVSVTSSQDLHDNTLKGKLAVTAKAFEMCTMDSKKKEKKSHAKRSIREIFFAPYSFAPFFPQPNNKNLVAKAKLSTMTPEQLMDASGRLLLIGQQFIKDATNVANETADAEEKQWILNHVAKISNANDRLVAAAKNVKDKPNDPKAIKELEDAQKALAGEQTYSPEKNTLCNTESSPNSYQS